MLRGSRFVCRIRFRDGGESMWLTVVMTMVAMEVITTMQMMTVKTWPVRSRICNRGITFSVRRPCCNYRRRTKQRLCRLRHQNRVKIEWTDRHRQRKATTQLPQQALLMMIMVAKKVSVRRKEGMQIRKLRRSHAAATRQMVVIRNTKRKTTNMLMAAVAKVITMVKMVVKMTRKKKQSPKGMWTMSIQPERSPMRDGIKACGDHQSEMVTNLSCWRWTLDGGCHQHGQNEIEGA
mmetsp:Transcript_17434/g.49233  ORF Transcript_17434/g.49233 Transcript_17434/m.49233 type:complete len:235 (-) Transcript_17434:1628-2332(-)